MLENKYKKLVNFKTNLSLSRHSWFDIKEGYSANLVENVIKDFKISKNKGYILDPFSGSGTTTIQSSILGYKSIGIEVNPFLYFLSINKSVNYFENLEITKKKFLKQNFNNYDSSEIPKLSISKKLFREQLHNILQIKKWISRIENNKTQEFFFCVFLCSLDKASYAKKDGNGLKYPKNRKPEKFYDIFIINLNKFIDDIQNTLLNQQVMGKNLGTKITTGRPGEIATQRLDSVLGERLKLIFGEAAPTVTRPFKEMEEKGQIQYTQTLDVHLDREEGDDPGTGEGAEGNVDGEGKSKGGQGPEQYTAEEKEKIKQEFQNAVMQSAKAAGAGNLPGGVKRLLNDLLNPQLDWRELLAMQVQSVIKSDYTYQTPSRKGQDAGFYLPGMDRESTIDIAMAMDTSGSMSDDMLLDILSETKGIMDQYTNFKIHLFCF